MKDFVLRNFFLVKGFSMAKDDGVVYLEFRFNMAVVLLCGLIWVASDKEHGFR